MKTVKVAPRERQGFANALHRAIDVFPIESLKNGGKLMGRRSLSTIDFLPCVEFSCMLTA
jgi:hypothetical protein